MPTDQPLVFVVDDETAIASSTAQILKKSGFDCLDFSNSLEALTAGEDRCPDVLIADLLMPGLNGFELGSRLRRVCPSMKVVILTGLGVADELIDQLRDAQNDFEVLTKPVHPPALIAIVERHNSKRTAAYG